MIKLYVEHVAQEYEDLIVIAKRLEMVKDMIKTFLCNYSTS